MVDTIICKPIKKFGHFEVWNDGMLRIRQNAEDFGTEEDTLIVFFPKEINEIKEALKFKDDVFGGLDE